MNPKKGDLVKKDDGRVGIVLEPTSNTGLFNLFNVVVQEVGKNNSPCFWREDTISIVSRAKIMNKDKSSSVIYILKDI